MASYTLIGHEPDFPMVRKYTVDSYDNIALINISQLLPGTTVFVISTSETYMLKHDNSWAKVALSSSTSSGGGSGSSSGSQQDGGDIDTSSGTDDGTINDGGDLGG